MFRRRHLLVIGCSIILVAILAAGCMGIPAKAPPGSQGPRKFNSTAEIDQYIRESAATIQQDGYYRTMVPTVAMGTGAKVTEQSLAVPAPAATGGGGSLGYSQTNIQVAGVDEPDIIKNDNRYIYVISGQNLVIIDAYPAGDASVISRIRIDDAPRNMFVDGTRLVLFSTGNGPSSRRPVTAGPWMDAVPPYYRFSTPITHATIYDISDRESPKILKDYAIDGDYIDARMVGRIVYLVTREQIDTFHDDPVTVPVLREGGRTVLEPDVWYFDRPEYPFTFTTITALDAADGKERDAQTYLLGSGDTIYVSKDAIYVSYPRYYPVIYRSQPGGPVPFSTGISRSDAFPGSIPPDFNTLPGEERQAIIDAIRNAEQDAVRRKEAGQTVTVIHKIGIRNGVITYRAEGEVPGTLHNQFSMDEYGGNLRVATTSSISTPRFGQYTYSNVYVLDENMATIGELTHIAEQETIYATRFIGDRLYMVTFRQIDPFFVIDLSVPQKPKVLGMLKIPGYSDYLHPYDARHIIGIGRETETGYWGGVSVSGVKLALFDVSDVSKPALVDSVQIGDAGSDSAALSDHHAFLFDRAKNLLVIPIRAVTSAPPLKGEPYSYRPKVWYGAYVFGLSPGTGFTLRGTVRHGSGENAYVPYPDSSSEVKRSLYIDDVLYTMSPKMVKANPLDDLQKTLATIPLPSGGEVYYPE